MERKRKLPARAAARVEHVSKKRTATPPERSLTPAPAPSSTPVPAEPIPEEPQLPKSIQPGHPLPTVETPQPEDLSSRDYQSIQESGVLAESLSRSRQKWIHEGIFEKYWTKPTKRKGVVKEDPSNPPKDSMMKIGQITVTVEPHVLEATMYGVKDPKPPPTTNSTFRPIIQYGPSNGVMPPPPKPSTPSTPTVLPTSPAQLPAQSPLQPPQSQSQPQAQSVAQPPAPSHIQAPSQPHPATVHPQGQQPDSHRPPPPAVTTKKPLASPRGLESVLAAPQHPPTLPPATGPSQPPPAQPNGPSPPGMMTNRPLHAPSPTTASPGPGAALPPAVKTPTPTAKTATPTQPGADPIIVTLAEKASGDPHLRDLMKRVAIGDAAPHELAHFQRIIDQITADYKRKGGQQGPSADRLIVDGRTVKYFADEVRTILDIVLASNPNQKSIDLRPPPGSDHLVILLVKKALDEPNTREIVRRIAEGKTRFADTTDLKQILDRLKDLVVKEPAKSKQTTPVNGTDAPAVPNGTTSRKPSLTAPAQPTNAPASQQALRSKGPPPEPKPDISAVVLEFAGGTGDRYLFPKYSILEYASPSQVVASFLIVRKGSQLEYGGDPALDYYQPVSIRLYSNSGKHLEHLKKVVAPQDDVRRYMDDIMDNMTRAEYVLLAMRLPRADREDQIEDRSNTPKAELTHQHQPQPSVLWTTKASSMATPPQKPVTKPLGDDEQYQSFITTIS